MKEVLYTYVRYHNIIYEYHIPSHMSVRVQVDLPEIQELVIFWSIPYLNSDAKISYVRTEKGMQLSDEYYGFSY